MLKISRYGLRNALMLATSLNSLEAAKEQPGVMDAGGERIPLSRAVVQTAIRERIEAITEELAALGIELLPDPPLDKQDLAGAIGAETARQIAIAAARRG
jgi:hypothetical protein